MKPNGSRPDARSSRDSPPKPARYEIIALLFLESVQHIHESLQFSVVAVCVII